MLSRGLLVGALVLLRHAAALGVFESTDFGTPDLLGFYRERLHVPERYAAAAGSEVIAHFGDNFEFGLATAPAHVEDALHDAWLDFARAGRVVAFNNTARPEERTRFWTEPEAELDLAAGAGATIFRMGADWTRLFPDGAAEMDQAAWARYREIMLMCHERGMRVMLTLFHHSLPPWLGAVGGWTNSSSVRHFETFARAVLGAIGADEPLLRAVHSVITMNEPHVFAMLTYCAGLWPPGSEPSTFDSLRCFTPWGAYAVAMANMARGHRAAHEFVAQLGLRLRVGAAHHVPCYNAKTVLDRPTQRMSELLTTFHFQDLIANASDFIGINYYGQEILDGASVALVASEEYSEAGRAIYPDGLFRVLVAFGKRYAGVPIFITENGIADSTDVLRPAYLVEHLLAVRAAIDVGVPVRAYVFWTITDNLEWADGYCPKFGLVAMNRTDAPPGLAREPRASYELFGAIARAADVTAEQRSAAWALVRSHARRRALRPFCRAADGKGALSEPVLRRFSRRDWRYGAREPAAGRAASVEQRLFGRVNATDWQQLAERLAGSWAASASTLQHALDDELGERERAARAALAELSEGVRAGLASASDALETLRTGAARDASDAMSRAEAAAAEWLGAVQRDVAARQRRDAAWLRRAGRALRRAWDGLVRPRR